MKPARVLVGSFEPFAGDGVNASEAAAALLGADDVAGATIETACLPCIFGGGFDALAASLRHAKPDILLLTGQAGGRAELLVERVALNLDDAAIADNAGAMPCGRPVAADGPAAYFAGIPAAEVAARLREEGFPAQVSNSAGTFVCNHVFYRACHFAAIECPGLRVGFIHVPFTPAQAARRAGAPSMASAQVAAALRLAIAAIIADRTA